jgi:ATP-dependent DNA helicase RecQ
VEHFAAAYRALQDLGAAERPVSASEVYGRAPRRARSKIGVVLAMLEDLEAMARQYRRRAEHDRDRLRCMVLYAQTRLCRWQVIRDYFSDELEAGGAPDEPDDSAMPAGRCGHCDNCRLPAARPPEVSPPAGLELGRQVIVPAGRREVPPLPPLLGDRDPEGLHPGDAVTLPIFGAGEVRAVDKDMVEVELADGETRQFKRGKRSGGI